MGEAAHGAHEFFEIKAQMFKLLVAEKGYRMFAIESTLGNTYSINRFLSYGEGNPKKALAELDNGYWNSLEILELVKWMRQYNEAHKREDHLFFYGFDVNSKRGATNAILKYISLVDSSYFVSRQRSLSIALLSSGKELVDARTSILTRFTDHEMKYIQKSSKWEYDLVKRCFVNLNQIDSMPSLSVNARDKFMADNVMWIYREVQPKMMLFAHNFHVANHETRRFKTMGYHLKKRLRAEYSPIGFDFYDGSVIAKKGGNVLAVLLNGNKNIVNRVRSPKNKTFSGQLACINQSVFCLDIQKAVRKGSSLRKWLQKPQQVHDLGAWCGRGDNQAPYKLYEAYDALIYVRHVSPSKHLVYPE